MPEVKTRSCAVNHRTLWSIIPIGGRNKATKPMIRAATNATIDIMDLVLVIEWTIKNLRVYRTSCQISIISYCYPTYLPITGLLTVGTLISIFGFDGASDHVEPELSVIPFPLGALKLMMFLFIPIR